MFKLKKKYNYIFESKLAPVRNAIRELVSHTNAAIHVSHVLSMQTYTVMQFFLFATPSSQLYQLVNLLNLSYFFPGIYEPAKRHDGFQMNLYVDGAMLNAFPLNVFDGK